MDTMSKKPTQFEKPSIPVMGKVPEEEKRKLSEEIGRRFSEGYIAEFPEAFIKKMEQAEYPKRPYELEFIEKANIVLNDLLMELGLEPINVSEKNIHIIPPDIYKESSSRGDAMYDCRRQLVTVDASQVRESPYRTARVFSHEMTHLKGFVSFDMAPKKEGDGYKRAKRRVGLITFESFEKSDKDEYYENFRGLNEAIVSEIENRYGKKVAESSNDFAVQEELNWLDSGEALEAKRQLVKDAGLPESLLDNDEIEWIDKNDKKRYTLKSYRAPRKTLHYLTEEIAAKEGKTKEEIMNLFFRAHFTGNIFEIAKLVEKVFGSGSFRVLGMMTDQDVSARQMLDYLRKQRIRIKKNV